MIGEGRIHDYEIFKNKHPTTPLQVENVLDLGVVLAQIGYNINYLHGLHFSA